MKKWGFLVVMLVVIACLGGCSRGEQDKKAGQAAMQGDTDAATTPFGRYQETVVYSLGKMTGLNNSNMPEGDTYENNAYTRYVKEKLNVQNKNVFEAIESDNFSETISMVIASKKLPDVMVVNDANTLQLLVDNDMVEDLTSAYKNCASDRIKEIYSSYGDSILDNATFDGKLMALPETNIANGVSMLWLRKDWMDKLGLAAPETLEDAEYIIQKFMEEDPGGNGVGQTLGLACDEELTGGCDYNYEYQVDIVFAKYGAYPKQWLYDKNGDVVYGSVQPQAKKALRRIRKMYQEGILDKDFLLRGTNNIVDAVVSGKCGSFFGPWWAPNNPLMKAMQNNPDADWKPYLIQTDSDGSTSFATQKPGQKWVVVRKGYEHPEIVMKIVSVLFDKMKYGESGTAEIAKYYQENVDPTARPLAINVDYYDALLRCYRDLKDTLDGRKDVSELGLLEGAYYKSCYRYLRQGKAASWEDWAAYTSRITACAILTEGKIRTVEALHFGDTPSMKLKWWKLKQLEKEAYLQIVTGQKSLDFFDKFVEQWYQEGGREITDEVQDQFF
ncbi:MAG: extracellular solute-binding protein [Lachnospiraceae bacterium]|jgi:putative aldouronate transport system substrate-binding protein|nr:extracellular solute-binding protein [Lachnospiraceae bacterium]